MSFKNNTALRTATIAASFLLTLLIAAFATGCAAEGSSDAQRCARKLRHRPRSGRFVHHYRAGELHGRDFRQPEQRVPHSQNVPRHPKAAIEQGQLRGLPHLRRKFDPHGKTFATTKNSQAGQEKKSIPSSPTTLRGVCGARA